MEFRTERLVPRVIDFVRDARETIADNVVEPVMRLAEDNIVAPLYDKLAATSDAAVNALFDGIKTVRGISLERGIRPIRETTAHQMLTGERGPSDLVAITPQKAAAKRASLAPGAAYEVSLTQRAFDTTVWFRFKNSELRESNFQTPVAVTPITAGKFKGHHLFEYADTIGLTQVRRVLVPSRQVNSAMREPSAFSTMLARFS